MKSAKTKGPTKRELYFCYHYINTGNLREAAALAGYKKEPEKKAIQILSKPSVKNEIERLYNEKKQTLIYKAFMGYERLAFGSVTDAVSLLWTQKPERTELESMDLFNIAEIKRSKDGAMEIKFFNRLDALEKLGQSDIMPKSEASPIYYALKDAAKILNSKDLDVRPEDGSGN